MHAAHLGILAHLRGAVLPEYFPSSEDICTIGYAECFPHVMIGNEHSDPRAAQVADNFLQILHGEGIDSREWLVEQNKRGFQGQRARDVQAPALSTRKRLCPALTNRVQ